MCVSSMRASVPGLYRRGEVASVLEKPPHQVATTTIGPRARVHEAKRPPVVRPAVHVVEQAEALVPVRVVGSPPGDPNRTRQLFELAGSKGVFRGGATFFK